MARPERFDGLPDPVRRDALDEGAESAVREGWAEYRRTTTTWARRMRHRFEVETMEGTMTGQRGDWLAVGIEGEMYPIAASVFEKSYEPVK